MRGATTAAAPSPEALRAMMAAAAAAASAAAGDAASAAALSVTEAPRSTRVHVHRPSANRRQSISMLPALLGSAVEPLSKNAPLPPVQSGARWERINAVAHEIAAKWTHPRASSQYETDTLHLLRAILYMNKSLITQSFVSHVSGVSQGSLSHYVRGLFRGNQRNIEERLNIFVQKFADGSLDQFLEEARSGSRALSRPSPAYMPTSQPQQVAPLTMTAAAPPPPTETETPSNARPPVPPPPPPQLEPAPWVKPPQPIESTLPPLSTPVMPTSALPPPPPSSGLAKHLKNPVLSERTRRAQQRQSRTKRPRSAFPQFEDDKKELTPTVAVEQAYHTLVASKWSSDYNDSEPMLIPIEIFVQAHGRILHTYTQWDVNERFLSPEEVAERIRLARSLPEEFSTLVAMQIRRCLFEAGVICPPPPMSEPSENRRLLKIVVELKEGETTQVLRDEFEWDLASGCMNSPELFAQSLCTDAKISQKHSCTVAHAIRVQLSRAHAIAYGDEETKRMALEGLSDDDPLRKELAPVTSALMRNSPEDVIARDREENEITISNLFIKPLFEDVYAEAERRKKERARNISEQHEINELRNLRQKETAEAAAQRTKQEMVLKAVDEQAKSLREKEGIDFEKYLSFILGRGERPSVWILGALERKKRGEEPLPMTRPNHTFNSAERHFSRFPKKRRAVEGKASSVPANKDLKTEAATTEEAMDKKPLPNESSVMLVLRIKPPAGKESREKRRDSKKRRR